MVKENTSSVIIKLEPETNNTLQVQLEQKGKIELYGIYFDTDKATLKPESEKTLKQLLAFINANPGTALEIGGHTDAQGDNAYNLQLSQQRAEAVISWLKANKAAVTNLRAKGYGETEPVADNSKAILLDPVTRRELQLSMSRGAGVLRSSDSLLQTSADLTRIQDRKSTNPCVEAWETTNLFQLAEAILKAALIRQETRGSHWREDFPETSDLWRKRIIQSVDQSGSWTTGYQEVGDQ